MGDALYTQLEQGLESEASVSLRINGSKTQAQPVAGEKVPWCDNGFYLKQRPNFTFDPLLHAGCYYVQEASSMFVAHALRQLFDHPVMLLDMCAAPGGKSTAAVGALPEDSVVVSNEPIRTRAQILAENITKWGAPATIVTNNYPDDFTKVSWLFDAIICDVPCSGEGMFRKDENAVGEWSVQNVEKCRQLQRDIVSKVWHLLAEDGYMIYSTCTFNTKENEENVDWICRELGAETVDIATQPEWNITGSLAEGFDGHVYRFIPGRTRGEGLFMAVLKKTSSSGTMPVTKGKDKGKRGREKGKGNSDKTVRLCQDYLQHPDRYELQTTGDLIIALPQTTLPLYAAIKDKLRIMKAGIVLGQTKGKDIIPQPSLALSTDISQNAFPQVDLDYGQAIAFLRREPVAMPEGTPRGYVLVSYNHHPLGFVKNIGNRANNLYPAEWKIKSSHVPDEYSVLDREK